MIFLPFMKTYNELVIGCIIYGIFAGGMPGNGPLVYSEDFKKDLPSAMGIGKSNFYFKIWTLDGNDLKLLQDFPSSFSGILYEGYW